MKSKDSSQTDRNLIENQGPCDLLMVRRVVEKGIEGDVLTTQTEEDPP